MHGQKVTTTTKQPIHPFCCNRIYFSSVTSAPIIRSVDATSFCGLSALCTHAQLLSCACWQGLLDWQLTLQLLAPLECLVVLHVQTFPLLRNVGTGSHTPGITWLENKQQNLPIMLFIWSIRVMLTSAWGSFSWVLALNLLYENDQWLLEKYQNLSVPTCETMPANVGFVCLRSQLFGKLSQFTKVIFIPAWGASLKAAQCSKRNPQSQCVLRLFYLRVSWKKTPAFSWWFPSLFILLCLFHVLSTVYLFSTAYILQ